MQDMMQNLMQVQVQKLDVIEDAKVCETKLGAKLDEKHGANDGTKIGIKPDVKLGVKSGTNLLQYLVLNLV